MSAQRFRIWFQKGERVRYISHLDVLRYWERAFRRAELPLAYSQGFTPHPKLAFAGPLPLGFAAEAEVLDATLEERVLLADLRERLQSQCSEDLGVVAVREVPVAAAPPQNLVTWADYRICLPGASLETVQAAIERFLRCKTFDWVDERREKPRTYDMRAGVANLRAEPAEDGVIVYGRLNARQDFTVRPEQVVLALLGDLQHGLIVRECLVLDDPSPARDAWRRRGRFEF